MKYLLKEMDDLVLSCLNPSASGLPSPEKPDALFLEIKAQAGKFKFELSKNFSSLGNENTGKQLVKNHLRRLVFLSDSLYRNILLAQKNRNHGNPDQLIVCFRVLAVLESLQQCLLLEYPAYSNRHLPVSLYTQKKMVKCCQEKLAKFWEQNNRTENELEGIVLSSFRRLVRNKKNHFSFASRQYMFRLMKILLLHLSVSSEQKDGAKTLQNNLFAINFNSMHFLTYYTMQIKYDVQTIVVSQTFKGLIQSIDFASCLLQSLPLEVG